MLAVLKRRLHKDIDRLDLREGSYIVLKEYRLATAPRLNGSGNIQYAFDSVALEAQANVFEQRYITVLDFYLIGEERRYESTNSDSQSTNTPDQQPRVTSTIIVDEWQHESSTRPEHYDTVRTNSVTPPTSHDVIDSHSNPNANVMEKDNCERKFLGTLPSFETVVASDSDEFVSLHRHEGIDKKRKRAAVASQTDSGDATGTHSPSQKLQQQKQRDSNLDGDVKAAVSRQTESPWARKAKAAGTPLQPIERPLRLSTLASVTGVNRSRNKVVDILALVDSVDDSTVKPVHLPLKRDIRITDGSTDRKIIVSIFVDPVDCIPSVGDIVLFRNLVTHDWKQGALNAYPKYCDGKDWYIPDPERVEGRGLELKDLKAKILVTEQKRRRSINMEDKILGEDEQTQKRQKYS